MLPGSHANGYTVVLALRSKRAANTSEVSFPEEEAGNLLRRRATKKRECQLKNRWAWLAALLLQLLLLLSALRQLWQH